MYMYLPVVYGSFYFFHCCKKLMIIMYSLQLGIFLSVLTLCRAISDHKIRKWTAKFANVAEKFESLFCRKWVSRFKVDVISLLFLNSRLSWKNLIHNYTIRPKQVNT